jgi:signal transduction histidine kinase
VDDREEDRALLLHLLQGQGYQVDQARNGAEALQKLRAESFDLVISDIMMPQMDGYQLCHLIRTDELLKQLPVIIYTATYTDRRDEALAMNLGASLYIIKPAATGEFLNQVKEVIERAASGELAQPKTATQDEITYLREYSERLIRKLEDKAVEAEAANRRLNELNIHLEQRVQEAISNLKETNHQLEAFAYSVSHDLRAPLRAIRGFSSLLLVEESQGLTEEQKDLLKRISGSAGQMSDLIDDLLAYSQLTTAEIHLTAVSLDWAVARATEQISREIQESKAEIRIQKPLPTVLAQEATLIQAVANLLGNAIKFVAPGVQPKVDIKTESKDGQVRILVIDNGIGIASEHRERIFNVFERLHNHQAYPGTGVGLAIVRKAIMRMRGHSGVESEPGRGSTFWIELQECEGV